MRAFDSIVEEYKRMTDVQLANEYNVCNAFIEIYWNDSSDDTSDRHDILKNLIVERFIESHATSYINVMSKDDLIDKI